MKNVYLIYPNCLGVIAPEIYGHFAEHLGKVIYDGIWVGKNSKTENINGFRKFIIDKMKEIQAPVIRWPGGCFAETYNWRDGIGKERPAQINWWTSYDNKYEPNDVGTHEFIDFCKSIGAKPYFAANITTTTPMDVRNWIDYCLSPKGSTAFAKERKQNGNAETFEIPYWGIGNENWGGGGNMTPSYYANEFKKYAVIAANTAKNLKLIACGANDDNYIWTKEFMEAVSKSEKLMSGYSLHYYCCNNGDSVDFSEKDWYELLKKAEKIEDIILRHWNIIKGFGIDKGLVIDEWGCWHSFSSSLNLNKDRDLLKYQSTMRDALVTAITLNVFNNHCNKIMMANVAQLVNCLHCLFLAEKDKCIVTPTYHVFNMYKNHQGANSIETIVETDSTSFINSKNKHDTIKNLSVSASYKENLTTVTITNLSLDKDCEINFVPVGKKLNEKSYINILTHKDYNAHNTFKKPDNVKSDISVIDLNRPVIIPKVSVVSIVLETK